MFTELINKEKTISITGLGYVGLPLALAFAQHYKVIGFDVNEERIEMMRLGNDPSKEIAKEEFTGCDIRFTSEYEKLGAASFHVVCVPTDVDKNKAPNLRPLLLASKTIGKVLKKGDYVVFESTVFPGCTEEECIPILEKLSGLKFNEDFKVGYSPERIVPGDKKNTFVKIKKIVSGSDEEALETIDKVYSLVLENGTYRAASIKVAEAAKVIENIQRDINISLMNELAVIFDKVNIDTTDVINAAASKWNFHRYTPGLVGGHCIGVDPYYLMYKAKLLGHESKVIAAGRQVNNYIPTFIAKRLVQCLLEKGKNPSFSKVLVMGITFKENVSDIRNSSVASLIKEIEDFSIDVDLIDPHASSEEVYAIYELTLLKNPDSDYDAVIIAVGHDEYKRLDSSYFEQISKDELILFDIKGIKNKTHYKNYWKL